MRDPAARSRAVATAVALLIVASSPPRRVDAQATFDVKPLLSRNEQGDITFGARWAATVEPTTETKLALSYPRETWWGARGEGAWLSSAAGSAEPLVDASAEFGLQVLLLKQHACTPAHCPEDLVGFDLGYVVLGLEVQGESDGTAIETMGQAGGVFLYRPPFSWSSTGVGFVVPTFSLGVGAAWPLRSALRAALGVAEEQYRRTDVAFGWTIRLERNWVPKGLQPLRFDAHLAQFTHGDLEQAIVDSVGTRGRFVAFDVGYALPERTRHVRDVFLRWSEGKHSTLPTGRKGWLLGVSIALGSGGRHREAP